jgi:uncharacterized membrane protein
VSVSARLGCWLLGANVTALGVQSLMLAIPVGRLEPVPTGMPGQEAIAYLTGAILLIVGICLLVGKWARAGAAALAILLLVWVLLLHLPRVVASPMSPAWVGLFETFALFGGAWLLAAMLPVEGGGRLWNRWLDRGATLGRVCFGASLPVFGASHFIYADFVASWVPKWIPYPLFWAYFTGVAHTAAGLSILTNVIARIAATLAAAMYGSWALIVHIPRIAAAPHDAFEWNGLFVASALSSSALLVAASFARERSDRSITSQDPGQPRLSRA